MIKFSQDQMAWIKSTVIVSIMNNGFHTFQVQDLFPSELTEDQKNIRACMFLCIGIGNCGQTLMTKDVFSFIKNGSNRFFLSLMHRQREMTVADLEKNHYTGKFNLSLDFYVAPTITGELRLKPEIIDEWNEMISCIETKPNHGVKFVAHGGREIGESKYILEDRRISSPKRRITSRKKM